MDNTGKRDALEIVYMKFFAYNGPYRPFGVIPTRTLGAHDRYCLSCFVLPPLAMPCLAHHPAWQLDCSLRLHALWSDDRFPRAVIGSM